MDTTSSSSASTPEVAFRDYTRYLEAFAARQALGDLVAGARPLTLPQYERMHRSQGGDELLTRLLPPRAPRRLYLASPLGFGEIGASFRREIHRELRALDVDVVDPWDSTPAAVASLEEAHQVGAANFRAIESCGRVLAILDGVDVDSGTAAEIGYATALGRRVDGLRTDPRGAGETTFTPVNLQVAYAIHASGGRIVRALRELGTLEWAQLPSAPSVAR